MRHRLLSGKGHACGDLVGLGQIYFLLESTSRTLLSRLDARAIEHVLSPGNSIDRGGYWS